MAKFTEPTTIIDSHHGRYITGLALEWCIEQGWQANGHDDLANIKRAIAADKEGGTEFIGVDDEWHDIADWLYDALDEAEDWATYKFADPDYDDEANAQSGMYFGTHPDLGDWGVWPIDDNWPNP